MKKLIINIDDKLLERLLDIQVAYQFDSVNDICIALFNLLDNYVSAAQKRLDRIKSNDSEVITEMFNEYGCWECTPDGIVPIRKNNKKME